MIHKQETIILSCVSNVSSLLESPWLHILWFVPEERVLANKERKAASAAGIKKE